MMVNQGTSTEGIRLEGGCNLPFLGEEGGFLGAEIGLAGEMGSVTIVITR